MSKQVSTPQVGQVSSKELGNGLKAILPESALRRSSSQPASGYSREVTMLAQRTTTAIESGDSSADASDDVSNRSPSKGGSTDPGSPATSDSKSISRNATPGEEKALAVSKGGDVELDFETVSSDDSASSEEEDGFVVAQGPVSCGDESDDGDDDNNNAVVRAFAKSLRSQRDKGHKSDGEPKKRRKVQGKTKFASKMDKLDLAVRGSCTNIHALVDETARIKHTAIVCLPDLFRAGRSPEHTGCCVSKSVSGVLFRSPVKTIKGHMRCGANVLVVRNQSST